MAALMPDTSCTCKRECCGIAAFEPCEARMTQEDLLCDDCRTEWCCHPAVNRKLAGVTAEGELARVRRTLDAMRDPAGPQRTMPAVLNDQERGALEALATGREAARRVRERSDDHG